ncbi:MAG: Asp-tRNA(Asn)/Glu-tRNA(Gln) amidotransferase subunit GatB [Candidatus Anstonellales archaeon]
MDVLIGLEIHVQLNTQSKLFCECKNEQEQEPNTLICEICTAQPGAKPKPINSYAVHLAYNAGYLLKCKLLDKFYLLRKHYFYPDLPAGYQRTSTPLAVEGFLDDVAIKEVHIEEDPGRYELKKGLVDYNRAGVPLIEIVTKPDIKGSEHAKQILKKLELGLRYYNIIKENGTVKVDANISIKGHNRVEVKNINSFENVGIALEYEIKRQKSLIERGLEVERETRHFDEAGGKTISLRKKETEEDYRYMPEPDLMPLTIDLSFTKDFGELPYERAERFIKNGINKEVAHVLIEEKEIADFYENLSKYFDKVALANWIKGPLKKQLNYRHMQFRKANLEENEIKVLLEHFFNMFISDDAMEMLLINYIDKGEKISSAINKYKKISDEELIEIIKKVIKENIKAFEDYKKGEEKALSFLVGKVMALTKGRADPKKTKKIIEDGKWQK